MRRLTVAVTKLTALVLGLVAAILVCPAASDYYQAFDDKMSRLATTPGERLVMVGGSSLAFGFDSEVAEREVHRPVINMGLHAGLGLSFMLEHVVDALHPGDVVFVVPEYNILDEHFARDDGTIAAALLAAFPTSLRWLRLEDVPSVLRGFSDFALHKLVADPLSVWRSRSSLGAYVYSRRGFDEHGDEIGHLAFPSPGVTFGRTIRPEVGPALDLLSEFDRRARAKGAVAILGYPSLAASDYRGNEPALAALDATVERRLTMRHAGHPGSAVLPDGRFFDTANHLDGEGRSAATVRLLGELMSALHPDGH